MSPMNGLLVRVPSGVAAAPALAGEQAAPSSDQFDFEWLFATSPAETELAAASAGKAWMLARPKQSIDGANPWDLAHAARGMMADGVGLAGDIVPGTQGPHRAAQA